VALGAGDDRVSEEPLARGAKLFAEELKWALETLVLGTSFVGRVRVDAADSLGLAVEVLGKDTGDQALSRSALALAAGGGRFR
jgi:hypothetical protein